MMWLENLRVDGEKCISESCSWKTTVHKKLLYSWNNLKAILQMMSSRKYLKLYKTLAKPVIKIQQT
jgi:hypothetical protein